MMLFEIVRSNAHQNNIRRMLTLWVIYNHLILLFADEDIMLTYCLFSIYDVLVVKVLMSSR